MRAIYLLSIALICQVTLSQSPQSFNYQAVVRNSSGEILQNQAVSLRIGILPEASDNAAIFSEIHNLTTNKQGLLNVQIGTGTVMTGQFDTIPWSSHTFFLQTEIDLLDGNGYVLLGVSQLLSVPYALHARTADQITDLSDDSTSQLQTLSDVLELGNNADGYRIANLGTPEDSNDAVIKMMTDHLQAELDTAEIRLTDLEADTLSLFNQRRIDSLIQASDSIDFRLAEIENDTSPQIPDLSEVLTIGADAGHKRITNLGDPVDPGDAVNKKTIEALESRLDLMEMFYEDLLEYLVSIDTSLNGDREMLLHIPIQNGTAGDSSAYNKSVTVHGAIPAEDIHEEQDGAFSFDGEDDYLMVDTLHHFVEHLESYAVSFWFNADLNIDQWGSVLGVINNAANGLVFQIDFHRNGSVTEPGRMNFHLRDAEGRFLTYAIQASNYFDNQWHHIVFNLINSIENNAEVYVDGEKQILQYVTTQSPQVFGNFDQPLSIGASNARGYIQDYFKGKLDGLRIYAGYLRKIEINQIYVSGPE